MEYSVQFEVLWDVNGARCWDVIFFRDCSVFNVNCDRRCNVIFCTEWSVVG